MKKEKSARNERAARTNPRLPTKEMLNNLVADWSANLGVYFKHVRDWLICCLKKPKRLAVGQYPTGGFSSPVIGQFTA